MAYIPGGDGADLSYIISKEIKTLEVGDYRKILYLCNWIEATLSKTYEKKKKRYAYL